jgi:hypothetical protein
MNPYGFQSSEMTLATPEQVLTKFSITEWGIHGQTFERMIRLAGFSNRRTVISFPLITITQCSDTVFSTVFATQIHAYAAIRDS